MLEATKCLIHILDAKYEKADLRSIVKDNCTHQSNPEQTKLLELLQEIEELFSGKLGDWDCKLVSLQLKEGAQPYHGRPFPIPKKHVDTTKRRYRGYVTYGYSNGKASLNGLYQHLLYQKKTTLYGLSVILGK